MLNFICKYYFYCLFGINLNILMYKEMLKYCNLYLIILIMRGNRLDK